MDNSGIPKVVKGEYPLDERTVIPVTRKNAKIRYALVTENDSAVIDGDKIKFLPRFKISVTELEGREAEELCALESSECEKTGARRITVYYPDSGESAWQIAKKYSQRVADLISNNPDSFDQDMKACAKRIVASE